MKIQENISLQPYNTFGIDKKAKFFAIATKESEVIEAIEAANRLNTQLIVLGGGSNILLTKDVDALVLKIEIEGIQQVDEDDHHIYVKVGAGENWHNFVMYCITLGWAGVENLSLIPGTVGASPMQNIGAYGVEIKEVFYQLRAIERENMEPKIFNWEECHFGYRESIFKNVLKDKYIITHVIFKLFKQPVFHTEYGAIQETLNSTGSKELTLQNVSDAVIQIRQSKLPDPKKIGNAGSFFKNPTLSKSTFEKLKKNFPNIPGYPNDEGVKVPAAWLIEQTGWKGYRADQIGVHKNQPLVLVNYGGGDGKAIEELSQKIQNTVKEKFGVELLPEVNFL